MINYLFVILNLIFVGVSFGAQERSCEKELLTEVSSASLSGVDEEGWAKVESPKRFFEDPSAGQEAAHGVVFFKQIEKEKFWVRFPKDPSYESVERGVVVRAQCEKGLFELFALSLQAEEVPSDLFTKRKEALARLPGFFLIKEELLREGVVDVAYKIDGSLILERWQATPFSVYFFHSEGPEMDENQHLQWIDSFSVFPR